MELTVYLVRCDLGGHTLKNDGTRVCMRDLVRAFFVNGIQVWHDRRTGAFWKFVSGEEAAYL